MQPKKLEHYKLFQPIAWTICISFAIFVGMLTLEFKSSIQNLQVSSEESEQRIQNLEKAIGSNSYKNPI